MSQLCETPTTQKGEQNMSKKAVPAEPANHIAVFQEKTIRRIWHNEEWWFSVADVCGVLTESADPGAWGTLELLP